MEKFEKLSLALKARKRPCKGEQTKDGPKQQGLKSLLPKFWFRTSWMPLAGCWAPQLVRYKTEILAASKGDLEGVASTQPSISKAVWTTWGPRDSQRRGNAQRKQRAKPPQTPRASSTQL